MFKYLLVLLILIIVILGVIYTQKKSVPVIQQPEKVHQDEIRYVPIGDSYTIGAGTSPNKAWPNLLTEHLKREGIPIRLVANPAVTGYTTEDVITYELPIFEASDPTFATLLIGTNDLGLGVTPETFQKRLVIILDRMQRELPDKQKLLVLTNPDHSAAPFAMLFGADEETSQGIKRFNEIIIAEAKKRNLPVVDLYPLSQKMKDRHELFEVLGFHPSAKGYELWEKEIFPAAHAVLRDVPHRSE